MELTDREKEIVQAAMRAIDRGKFALADALLYGLPSIPEVEAVRERLRQAQQYPPPIPPYQKSMLNPLALDTISGYGEPKMKTNYTEIKPAIARSISHTEAVIVEVTDTKAALEQIDNDENVTDLDWTSGAEKGSMTGIDVWGKRLGEDFRLFLVTTEA
jgi:hypothetical protein